MDDELASITYDQNQDLALQNKRLTRIQEA